MKACLFMLMVLCSLQLRAQELFVFSEPASNMPARSVAPRITARYPVMKGSITGQRYITELMAGVSKQLMIHGSATFSDLYTPGLRWESVKAYAKWRFYSDDDIHRHFRMAAYAEGSYSRNPFRYEEINLDGDHSGVQAGLVATQLVNKLAVSATAGVTKAFAAGGVHAMPEPAGREVMNYLLSAGYLLLPRNYTSFRQTNVNLYLELIGMKGLGHNGNMIDLAPALQVILNSNLKLNAGYRFQVAGNMLRMSDRSWLIGIERTFLGVLRKKKPL